VLNAVQLLATASDLAGKQQQQQQQQRRYRDAALTGIDYVLGRNALAQSYIRDYGSKYTLNVHSRLYAHELNEAVPRAPPGTIAGGANSKPSDPPADDVLPGCKPQLCYIGALMDQSSVLIEYNTIACS
jgi:endoglucanase